MLGERVVRLHRHDDTPHLHYKHEYTFDLAGNRLTKKESVDNGSGWDLAKDVAYTYDHRDRLLVEQAAFFDNSGVQTGASTTEFDYNRNGFLRQKASTLSGSAPGDDELFVFTPTPKTGSRRPGGRSGASAGREGRRDRRSASATTRRGSSTAARSTACSTAPS